MVFTENSEVHRMTSKDFEHYSVRHMCMLAAPNPKSEPVSPQGKPFSR